MCETKKLPELFGSLVFNEGTMKERLSSASYSAWKKCVTEGTPLDLSTANEIAEAMKQWAVEKGATHFTHWFQPMTGVTAEKHDSFIAPVGGGKLSLIHISEPTRQAEISYAVFCLKKKKQKS